MANHRSAKAPSAKSVKPQGAAVPSTTAAGTAESKPATGSKPNSLLASSLAPVSAETRRAMIAEAAYYIAEQRGFGYGCEVEDWLLAEKQIDGALSA
ncbi:MAG TPA: DUF2934 domain-containing protein [Steroidobacteraceae bacterium]|nr:DUF2934 domain-containing protein [Steroidobacteraceae bacterium]